MYSLKKKELEEQYYIAKAEKMVAANSVVTDVHGKI